MTSFLCISDLEKIDDSKIKEVLEALPNEISIDALGDHLETLFTKEENKNSQKIIRILYHTARLSLDFADPKKPFVPFYPGSSKRSADVDDFSEEQKLFLVRIANLSTINCLKSRLYDLMWVLNRNFLYAKNALEIYLKIANEILSCSENDRFSCLQSLCRAVQLWRLLGSNNDTKDELLELNCKIVDHAINEKDVSSICVSLKIINKQKLYNGKSDIEAWKNQVYDLSKTYRQTHKFSDSQILLDCCIFLSEDPQKKILKKEKAEVLLEEARIFASSGADPILTAFKYTEVIDQYKKLGSDKDSILMVEAERNRLQKNIETSLKLLFIPFDDTVLRNHAVDQISDKSFNDAIIRLGLFAAPRLKSKLEEEAKKSCSEFIYRSLAAWYTYSGNFRLVGRVPPLHVNNDGADIQILAEMISHCYLSQRVNGLTIRHGREIVCQKFHCRMDNFDFLLLGNPFVEEDRIEIFREGFKAGYEGNFLVSTSVLIPQIEHMIRSVMEKVNATFSATKLTRSEPFTQKERDLNDLLFDKETSQYFGEDLIFSLRTVFVEELGGNIRNKAFHGLLRADCFTNEIHDYIWALTIYLCYLGKARLL